MAPTYGSSTTCGLRRYSTKSKPCPTCNGPCGNRCSTEGTAAAAAATTEDVADTFLRIAKELKRKRDELASQATAPTDGTASSSSVHTVAPQLARGRAKRARKACAPAGFGQAPAWLIANPMIGGVKIHPTHHSHLGWHRGLVWCWVCGKYATRVPIELKKRCDGLTDAGMKSLSLLRQGKPPTSKVSWPDPT